VKPAGHDAVTERVLAALLVASAWACYLPLGSKYATVLAATWAATHLLRRRREGASLRQAPALVATGALLAWLAITSLWSPAPWGTKLGQLAQYGLLLVVPVIATACPGPAARRALQHFVWASVSVATLFALAKAGWLPASDLAWHTTVDAEGNQRIATSVLLALGAGVALLVRRGCQLVAAVGVAGRRRLVRGGHRLAGPAHRHGRPAGGAARLGPGAAVERGAAAGS
jgi:hypothetical protein